MKKSGLSYFLLIMILVSQLNLLDGCIQKFQPVLSSPQTGYLVVEAIINAAGPAQVSLSRTTLLSDSSFAFESGAAVNVEGSDSTVYPFTEQGGGVYTSAMLNLNATLQYRLRIKTTGGEAYLSDFVPVNQTPPIDSVSWVLDSAGIQNYVSTHDPANNTHYYKWDYVETWEFHSPYTQQFRYDTVSISPTGVVEPGITPIPSGEDSSINTCWQSAQSTAIYLGSSAALSRDIITDFPLDFIPSLSVALSVKYSVLVNQYALSADEFNFLTTMQKNTTETGSVFGAEPSSLQGNIRSLTNPAEMVVGYVGFSTVASKRIFIARDQLPAVWTAFYPGCVPDTVLTIAPAVDPYYQIKAALYSGLLPTMITGDINGAIQFLAVPLQCINCTLTGTNIKPSFWQ